MKKILYVAVAFLLMMSACRGTEHTEAVTAEVEAAQMEGKQAARVIVGREWPDSMELQRELLRARAKSSRYTEEGHPELTAAFDSAFISTIRTIRPELNLR